jgi:hypothetical protein
MFNEPHNSSISRCTSSSCLVLGAVASPAFAGGYKKRDKYGDSSATITVQKNLQKQKISGFLSFGSQDASHCIAVLNGANAYRQQGTGDLVSEP